MKIKNPTRLGAMCSLASMLWCTAVFAQSSATKKGVAFDHTTVLVRDLQKSAEFYEKVFGLEKIADPFKDEKHIWLRIGPHEQLHIVGGAKEAVQPDIEVHFAFRVASLTDFMKHLDQLGVKYRAHDGEGKVTLRPDGVHQIYFQDPDGYWIEVNDRKI